MPYSALQGSRSRSATVQCDAQSAEKSQTAHSSLDRSPVATGNSHYQTHQKCGLNDEPHVLNRCRSDSSRVIRDVSSETRFVCSRSLALMRFCVSNTIARLSASAVSVSVRRCVASSSCRRSSLTSELYFACRTSSWIFV